MITIEPGSKAQAEDMHYLLRSELQTPDSLEEIAMCVERYPSYVALNQSRDMIGLSYTFGVGIDVLLLQTLHVHHATRSNKVGSWLLDATENEARLLGYNAMILTNSMLYEGVDKRSAVPFYNKHGYRELFSTFHHPATYLMVKELK